MLLAEPEGTGRGQGRVHFPAKGRDVCEGLRTARGEEGTVSRPPVSRDGAGRSSNWYLYKSSADRSDS